MDQSIADNLARVRQAMTDAAGRVGRPASSVQLIAVSKTFPASAVAAAAACGHVDFGENKVQEAQAKQEALLRETPSGPRLRWHLIGHLQSNKARKAVALFDVIHSIDSVDLLRRVDQAAAALGRDVDVLIQVDMAGEATKHGAPVEEVPAIIDAAFGCHAAHLVGLMVLPPASDDPAALRASFAALRRFRDDLLARDYPPPMLRQLSMGMSHDFPYAIEEGATMVRVGSAIFGTRQAR